jgi:EAL domain-containing protein (putative c-di-GMP-specific phosphodiesterase class I)/PAS domain-containing protein
MEPDTEKFRVIRPVASAIAVIVTTAALIFAIYFTERDQLWIPFLSGILVASTLAAATRVLHTERVAMRRAEELVYVRIKLDRETQLRESVEEQIATSKSRLILIDEELPIMVALIGIDGRCQHYNRRFMDWLHLNPQQIQSQHIREILGTRIYWEVSVAIRQALDGHPILYERKQRMADTTVHRLLVEHLPQFSNDGKVSGFYMLINDITPPKNVERFDRLEVRESGDPINILATCDTTQNVKINPDMLVDDPFNGKTIGQNKDTRRIMNAIQNGEFCLFYQLITNIADDSDKVEHCEILIRLKESENILLLPAEFFPLAKMNGHMEFLDRWVIESVIKWVSRQKLLDKKRSNSMFFINISDDSITDPDFAEFLRTTLQAHGVSGSVLCFEMPTIGLVLRNAEIADFVSKVKTLGCRVAISGFNQDRVLFDLMQGIKVDFLKIDGDFIRNILNNSSDLATVNIINKEAKKLSIKTIAESVENAESLAKLRKIGINFAQGHWISRPQPFEKKLLKTYFKTKVA